MAAATHRAETSRTSAVFLLSLTLFGALLGLPFMGKVGLLVGALGGLCVAIVLDASFRASRDPRLKSGAPMDLAGLDDQQKLAVLGQGLSAGAGDFRSEVLRGVDEARALAADDLEAGWRQARELAHTHPRNPAAWRLVGALAREGEREAEAIEADSRALELAAQGGLNQLLIDFFDELAPAARASLTLSRSAWTQVGAALGARGRSEDASFAVAQAAEVDPELDAKRRASALKNAASALRAAGNDDAADISDLLAAGRSQS